LPGFDGQTAVAVGRAVATAGVGDGGVAGVGDGGVAGVGDEAGVAVGATVGTTVSIEPAAGDGAVEGADATDADDPLQPATRRTALSSTMTGR
jgi:hypothetical protein